MQLAANALRCARTSDIFVDDERNSGAGEVIGVKAAAAVMGAAPSGVDRVECAREPARLPNTPASRCASRTKPELFDEDGKGSGAESDVGVASTVTEAAPTGVVSAETANCAGTRPHGVERLPRAHVCVFIKPRESVLGAVAEGGAATPSADEQRTDE